MARTNAHASYPQTDEPMTLANGQPLEPLPWVRPAPGKDGKPITLTPKQSAFVAYYLASGNASEAYLLAYDTDATRWTENALNVQGCRMLAHPKIRLTVDYYLELIADEYDITQQSITRTLMEAQTIAQQTGDIAEMRQCAMAIAKIHGLVIDRKESKTAKIELTGSADAIAEVFRMARDDRQQIEAEWTPESATGGEIEPAATDDTSQG